MESKSKETTPNKEDLDFIVDKEPNYILEGEDFKRLTKSAKKLGAESLDYSKRKNNKYMATLPGGKKVHFGSPKYSDYTIHKDKERRDKYLLSINLVKQTICGHSFSIIHTKKTSSFFMSKMK